MELYFTDEEKILINIIFFTKRVTGKFLQKVDFEKFVKVASTYLLLPVVYQKLKTNKLLKFIPSELNYYLKEIYQLNLKRNEILVDELNYIEKILNSRQINYLKLKGAYYLEKNELEFKNIRMIGDIDILIQKKQIKECLDIFLNEGYKFHKPITKFWKKRHIPKLVKNDKVFSIELHEQLLLYLKSRFLKADYFFENIKKNENELYIKHLILNDQINDYNFLNAGINLKSIFDFYLLNQTNISLRDYDNKYYRRFFLLTDLIGITHFNLKCNIDDKLFILRYNFKRKFYIYFLIDSFICNLIKTFPIRINQFIELFINQDYRKYVLKKVFR